MERFRRKAGIGLHSARDLYLWDRVWPGGFFSEAVKAKRLLFAAMLDSAITPRRKRWRHSRSCRKQWCRKQTRIFFSRRRRTAVFCALLSLCAFCCSSTLFSSSTPIIFGPVRPLWIPWQSFRSQRRNRSTRRTHPDGLFLRGTIHQTAAADMLAFDSSSRVQSKGTLYVVANRFQNRWDLQRVALWTGAKRLDLSPPTAVRTFDTGFGQGVSVPWTLPRRIFERSPAYLAARLGLDVTVMPVVTPGPETADAAARQLIAEKSSNSSHSRTSRLQAIWIRCFSASPARTSR